MDNNFLTALAGLMRSSMHENNACKNASSTGKETGDKPPSIFDISNDDRNRILKLVEELLDTQEDVEKYKEKLDEERTDFREKRSVLIKKLDRLSEKYEKALSDNQLIKERYCSTLKTLEEKISIVSVKLEESVMEINKLRQANAELINENSKLRKLNTETVALVASLQEKSKTYTPPAPDKHTRNEKRHRKKPNKVSSGSQANSESGLDNDAAESSVLEQGDSTRIKNISRERINVVDNCSGAGDFIESKNSGTFVTQPPAMVIFDKNMHSAFRLTNDTNGNARNSSSPYELRRHASFNFTNDLEDAAILENLFFRF